MGIQGLLQSLKPFVNDLTGVYRPIHYYAGSTLCVDASSWLHKAAYSCAADLDTPTGEVDCAPRYIKSFMKKVLVLLETYKVKRVVLVFDGQRIPLKAETNKQRDESRDDTLRKARELKAQGRMAEANKMYLKSAKPTRTMTDLLKQVRREGGKHKHTHLHTFPALTYPVTYITSRHDSTQHINMYYPPSPSSRVMMVQSPFEADAQLVSLCQEGVADAIITEDR